MDDFYRDYILDHYRNPRNFGTLENADAQAHDVNPLCGDEVSVQLVVDEQDRVKDIRFNGKGCAISQASTSMLTEEVKGMPLADVVRLTKDTVLENLGIGIDAQRIKCATLGLHVIREAALGKLSKD